MSKASGLCTFNIADDDDVWDKVKPMEYEQFEGAVIKW